MPEGWSGSGPRGRNCQSAPGRLWASSRPALRPVCEVLAALAPGRVLPFAPGNSRKRGPELSQGVRALANAAVERRKASGLPIKPASAPRALAGGNVCRCGADIGWMRLSALRFPLYEPGASLKESCCRGPEQTSDADGVARTRFHFVIASEAKQSRFLAAKVWIASSLSLSSGRPLWAGPVGSSQCWVDGPRRHQVCQAGRVMTTTSKRTVRYEHYHNWA